MPSKEHLDRLDWVKWLAATICAAVTMSVSIMAWAYSTFTTKDVFDLILKRLDRIEIKIDRLSDD